MLSLYVGSNPVLAEENTTTATFSLKDIEGTCKKNVLFTGAETIVLVSDVVRIA
ncbi:MAG: hypothetical protein ACI4N3_00205 [Alphaproteobacteria bacterium]